MLYLGKVYNEFINYKSAHELSLVGLCVDDSKIEYYLDHSFCITSIPICKCVHDFYNFLEQFIA
jgi:hypothetical protein